MPPHSSESWFAQGLAARRNLEFGATILRVRVFVRPLGRRTLLTIADCLDARLRDPVLSEIRFGRGGATLSEREVVLRAAALVRVSFDANLGFRVIAQVLRVGLEMGSYVLLVAIATWIMARPLLNEAVGYLRRSTAGKAAAAS